MDGSSLFSSFWIAGYECACHINIRGIRLDMLALTQHDRFVGEDYRLLRSFGISTARDGIRWPLIDAGRHYDFSSFLPMLSAARESGIQIIWDLCHYGWPDDLNVLSAAFVERFARFARAVARVIADSSDEIPFFTPINEMSYLSYAIGQGVIYPFIHGNDAELKRQFVRASIAAIDAARTVDARARFVFADPLVYCIEPRGRPDLRDTACAYDEAQFQAWDMIAGRQAPELGGSEKYLDIVGVNYYHSNQFEFPDQRLRWEDSPRDPRMLPFSLLLERVHQRYRRPIFVAETSHFGVGRARWVREIASETSLARNNGIPVEGVCLYPIIDRPDWNDFDHWHNSGLWDLHRDSDGTLRRILNPDYAAELRRLPEFAPLEAASSKAL